MERPRAAFQEAHGTVTKNTCRSGDARGRITEDPLCTGTCSGQLPKATLDETAALLAKWGRCKPMQTNSLYLAFDTNENFDFDRAGGKLGPRSRTERRVHLALELRSRVESSWEAITIFQTIGTKKAKLDGEEAA